MKVRTEESAMSRSVFVPVVRVRGNVKQVDLEHYTLKFKLGPERTTARALIAFGPVHEWLLSHYSEQPKTLKPVPVIEFIPHLRGFWKSGDMFFVEIGPTAFRGGPFDAPSRFYELAEGIAREFMREAGLCDVEL
jgi:hypothetical protein